jgi:TPR repeat protein
MRFLRNLEKTLISFFNDNNFEPSLVKKLLQSKKRAVAAKNILINGIIANQYDDSMLNHCSAIYYQINGNINFAKKYYLIGIEQGNAYSMNNYALIINEEGGDIEEVKKYLNMAIELKCNHAMNNYAAILIGTEVKHKNDCQIEKHKNYDEAVGYYKMSIENGSIDAKNNLAMLIYMHDKESAVTLLHEAYSKGNKHATNNLGYYYGIDSESIPDNIYPDDMYYIAAKKGNWVGCNNVCISDGTDNSYKVLEKRLIKYIKKDIHVTDSYNYNIIYSQFKYLGKTLLIKASFVCKYDKDLLNKHYTKLLEYKESNIKMQEYMKLSKKGYHDTLIQHADKLSNIDPMRAEKCYKYAIDNGCNEVLIKYADSILHRNKEEAVSNYLKALANGVADAVQKLKDTSDNLLSLYNDIYKIEPRNAIINTLISELLEIYDVHCYKRKIEQLSKIGNCDICTLENTNMIPLECMHWYCYSCYAKLEECPMRCNKLRNHNEHPVNNYDSESDYDD